MKGCINFDFAQIIMQNGWYLDTLLHLYVIQRSACPLFSTFRKFLSSHDCSNSCPFAWCSYPPVLFSLFRSEHKLLLTFCFLGRITSCFFASSIEDLKKKNRTLKHRGLAGGARGISTPIPPLPHTHTHTFWQ